MIKKVITAIYNIGILNGAIYITDKIMDFW